MNNTLYIKTALVSIGMLILMVTVSFAKESPDILQDASIKDILNYVKTSDSQATMINVWATWCQPCVDEMPDLLKVREDLVDQGFELILISTDFKRNREKVIEMLQHWEVNFTTYFKIDPDNEFIETLHPEWRGVLPATFLYDKEGKVVWYHFGKGDYQTFHREIIKLLK